MPSGSPARFPNGVTNVPSTNPLGMLGAPDPTQYHYYWNDFDEYVVGDWTLTTTEAGAGSATEALGDGDGGLLVITNDAADNDNDFFQKVGESFRFSSAKKLFFKARFKVSDVTQADFYIGLMITDTTPLDVTDGIFFMSEDGDALLDFNVEKDNTQTTAVAATMANDTFIEVAFAYTGKSSIDYFINGVRIGSSVLTNVPDDEDLTISFGIQNGEAVAKIMTVDYIFCAKER